MGKLLALAAPMSVVIFPLEVVVEERIEGLVGQMTLEEKVSMVSGTDFWTTPPVERLGIPQFKVSDGPNGARGGRFFRRHFVGLLPRRYCSSSDVGPGVG